MAPLRSAKHTGGVSGSLRRVSPLAAAQNKTNNTTQCKTKQKKTRRCHLTPAVASNLHPVLKSFALFVAITGPCSLNASSFLLKRRSAAQECIKEAEGGWIQAVDGLCKRQGGDAARLIRARKCGAIISQSSAENGRWFNCPNLFELGC